MLASIEKNIYLGHFSEPAAPQVGMVKLWQENLRGLFHDSMSHLKLHSL